MPILRFACDAGYRYKFGGTLPDVLQKLYREGGHFVASVTSSQPMVSLDLLRLLYFLNRDSGIARLYQGLLPWAIFQAPLSRFGDVAANDMVLALMGALFPQAPGPR